MHPRGVMLGAIGVRALAADVAEATRAPSNAPLPSSMILGFESRDNSIYDRNLAEISAVKFVSLYFLPTQPYILE
jgi:hypothetical protein